jgi:hypothetical protein
MIREKGGTPDGIFARWEWDGRALVVENDRYGIYPLYYSAGEGRCVVSPSVPELLKHGAPGDLDFHALAVFLHLGYFLGEDTPFKAIRALPPGARLKWTDGRLTLTGRRPPSKRIPLSRSEALDAYITLFRAAVWKRPPRDERSVVLLSGGRDSRHILFELVRCGFPIQHCLTMGPQVPYQGSEADVAGQLTKLLGLNHLVVTGEGPRVQRERANNRKTNFCADEHAWLLPAAETLRRKVSSIYDGIAGDVLSAGLYLTADRLGLYRQGRFKDLAEDLLGQRTLLPLVHERVRGQLSRAVARDRLVAELETHGEAVNPISSFFFWNRTRREIALSPYRLFGDIGTVYAPYLDHAVYDLLAGLDAELFVDHQFHTEAINLAFPQYAHIPYSSKPSGPTCRRSQCRRFALDILAQAARRRSALVNKSFLMPRLLRSLVDPTYLSSVLWLGQFSLYLLQLEAPSE